MDWMEQEQERGFTITSAATTCFWKGMDGNYPEHLNQHHRHARPRGLYDRGRALVARARRRVHGLLRGRRRAAAIRNGVAPGVKYGVPRLAFVNKMDRQGANFFNVFEQMKTRSRPIRCRSRFRSAPRKNSKA
jgi:elongation factor G